MMQWLAADDSQSSPNWIRYHLSRHGTGFEINVPMSNNALVRLFELWPWLYVIVAAVGLGMFMLGSILDLAVLRGNGLLLIAPALLLLGTVLVLLVFAGVLNLLVIFARALKRFVTH